MLPGLKTHFSVVFFLGFSVSDGNVTINNNTNTNKTLIHLMDLNYTHPVVNDA